MLRRTGLFTALTLLVGALLAVFALPTTRAQDTPFATNTPRPPVSALLPDAPIDFYALRLWDEAALVDVLIDQIRTLTADDTAAQDAIRLTQYELQRRFPAAPRDAIKRETLLMTMLAAPRGSVDMRAVARATLENALPTAIPSLDTFAQVEINGWSYEIRPINIDNRPPLDALVSSTFPANATGENVLYEDYVLVSRDANGAYRIFPADYPAAPLGDVDDLALLSASDLNGGGASDLALALLGDDLNDSMVILGWRGERVESLVLPDEPILFANAPSVDGSAFTTQVYRVESQRWGCLGERSVTWSWSLNYFRPTLISDFADQPSLACTLRAEEPLFAQPLDEAIPFLESLLASLPAESGDPSQQRARLALAVLYALEGRTDDARRTAELLGAGVLDAERSALLRSLDDGAAPAQVCAAVARVAESPASALCDMDAVLERLFTEQPLRRDESVPAQLAALGIRVRDELTLRQVGRLDRELYSLDMAGLHWWAFAPLDRDVYTAERAQAPDGYAPAAAAPAPDVARQAYDAILRGDAITALVVLDNATAAGRALGADSAYLHALALDLTGNRAAARAEYYALWTTYPTSVWGQLAAAHLERR
jgi:hypothetical protein